VVERGAGPGARESALDPECCSFVWDAEQLLDTQQLCTTYGPEWKSEAGEERLGASQLASEALSESVSKGRSYVYLLASFGSLFLVSGVHYSYYIRFLFRGTCSSILIHFEEVQENRTL